MPARPKKTQLELDFLQLEEAYSHDPAALTAIARAAAISTRYVDFIVQAILDGCTDPAKTYKFALNVKAHTNRHKNDAAAITRLKAEVQALKQALTNPASP